MAKNSVDVYGALGKSNVLYFDPETLVLVTDESSPLYDERVHLPIHEPTVLNMMHQGVLQAIVINKNAETGLVEVVDGRQRVKNAREANKRLRAKGCEPIMVPAIPRRAEPADLAGVMVSANELRTEDTPMGRARKMRQLQNLGKDEGQLAMMFGCTAATVRATMALLDCTAAVRSAVEQGKIGAGHALKLSKLPPQDQKAKLETLLAAAISLKGHAKAKAQAAVIEPAKPKLRTRKEVQARLESAGEAEAAVLRWVLGEDIAAAEGQALMKKIAAEVRSLDPVGAGRAVA